MGRSPDRRYQLDKRPEQSLPHVVAGDLLLVADVEAAVREGRGGPDRRPLLGRLEAGPLRILLRVGGGEGEAAVLLAEEDQVALRGDQRALVEAGPLLPR